MDSTQRPIGPNDVARRNPKTKVIIGFQKVSGNYEAMPSGKEKGALKLTASNLKLIAFEEEKDEGGYIVRKRVVTHCWPIRTRY